MLRLEKLNKDNYPLIVEMMDEWTNFEERIIPSAINKVDYHNYDTYKESLEVLSDNKKLVPDSTYFCIDEDRNIIVGAINIRHYLNDSLLLNGGHIGDGIRPSERKKGLGTKMIALALEKCKELNILDVLMVCDKTNIASSKTIINNGGILENEIVVEGVTQQRYWIKL